MGKEPHPTRSLWVCSLVVGLATLAALGLMLDQVGRSSATYDETAYLRIGARWWRTGDSTEISRMGSPVTFLKLQQAPALWLLDRLGHGDWIDDPARFQPDLLPWVRLGALPISLAALLVTAIWARAIHGPRAMALAATLFAFSPNLLGHGALVTMELPAVAASAGAFVLFWWFLRSGRQAAFLGSAALAGLAFAVKFTAVLLPPILGATWVVNHCLAPRTEGRLVRRVMGRMIVFGGVMLLTDLILTGFRLIPASPHGGDHPAFAASLPGFLAGWANAIASRAWPQDLVAFAVQTAHQRRGGPSYLLGETRQTGWWYYYFVALAVKAPLAVGWLALASIASARFDRARMVRDRTWFPALVVILFIGLAAAGSKRNYGVRYLLPASVPAIVAFSALAERGRWSRRAGWAGAAGMALAVASIHPYELSFFNRAAGGPIGGRRILSDSNLDWGQGLRDLARLQDVQPGFRNLTLFYFGDIDPAVYDIRGRLYQVDANHPPKVPPSLQVDTPYLAVSASLRWGPWGPPGYFDPLRAFEPMAFTADTTIAIYRIEPGDLRGRADPATVGLPRRLPLLDHPGATVAWIRRRRSNESGFR